jgi:RimJ/RimL family protein N-acetyltransferase
MYAFIRELQKMEPLLIECPAEFSTERLLLRTPRAGDGKLIYPSVFESLEELKLWMPWANDEYNEDGAEEWCRRAAAYFITREQLQFLILSRGGEHVGTIGAQKFDWNIPKGEIGYWLRTSHTGQGLMSEAVNALTQFLIETLQFKRVEIRMDEKNSKSWRVAERCGFQLDGTFVHDSRALDGSLRNTRIYSRIS